MYMHTIISALPKKAKWITFVVENQPICTCVGIKFNCVVTTSFPCDEHTSMLVVS